MQFQGERPFQDAKNQCKMGEYQAHGWLAWHHHMSMVMPVMLFIIRIDSYIKVMFFKLSG
jgi:SRSO17 transposase